MAKTSMRRFIRLLTVDGKLDCPFSSPGGYRCCGRCDCSSWRIVWSAPWVLTSEVPIDHVQIMKSSVVFESVSKFETRNHRAGPN